VRFVTIDAADEAADGDGRSRILCVALLAMTALLFVWVRAPLLSIPLERDEGEYAYIAQRMLAGEVPYRDAFDQKPPAVFGAYLAAFALFGESTEGIHLFLHAWTALTALLLYEVLRRLGGALPAAFGTLIFAVASASVTLTGNAANTEIFMLLPMVASAYGLLRAVDARSSGAAFGWWLSCGAGAAFACWFKPVAATWILLVFAVVVSEAGGVRWLVRAGLGVACGVGIVSAASVGWLVSIGAWDAFVDAVVLHNLDYAQGNSLAAGIAALKRRFAEQAPGFAVYWALAVGAIVWPGLLPKRARWWLGGWWIVSAAGVAVGLYFRPHYFFQLLPAQSGLAGFALAAVASRPLRSRSPGIALAGAASCAAVAVASPLVAEAPIRNAESPAAISREIYGTNPFVESEAIGKYIRRTSAADDRVYIVGSEPQILFYADRRSATRYIFVYPLTGDYPGVLDRQREVAEQIAAVKPLYIVWSNIATSLLVDAETETFLFEQAQALIARSYRLELVAHPVNSHERFEFAYGVGARRLMQSAGERAGAAQWIALYRRKDGVGASR